MLQLHKFPYQYLQQRNHYTLLKLGTEMQLLPLSGRGLLYILILLETAKFTYILWINNFICTHAQ